jgi:CheY-like chemotaxis protein
VDNKRLGFSLGAAEYLVKPVDKNLLLRKLRSLEKIARIRRILVVDDDPRTVVTLRELLEAEGYETRGSQSSGEAVASLQETPPDLIVLNPLTTGEEGVPNFMEQLKANPETRDIPLILLSREKLSPEDLEHLNGHIRAILNRGMLTEEALGEELLKTIRRCNRTLTSTGEAP